MPLISNYAVKQNPARVCPPEISSNIIGLRVPIWTPLNGLRAGIVEVNRDVAQDIEDLFFFMVRVRFPVVQALPVAVYDFSDVRSMLANNTSAFNYRMYKSESDGVWRFSTHSSGLAIDINPFFNPDMKGLVANPKGAVHDPSRPGTLTAKSPVTLWLKKRGWIWGGDWEKHQDYQHFQKG